MSSDTAQFSAADYAVFTSSLVISLAIGVYFWWKQRGKDNSEFLMGGGKMSPIPSAISMLAGTISAISLLGNSGEMYYYGSQLWTNCIGTVIGGTLVALIIIPVVYPLKLTSMYKYFELRWESQGLKKFITIVQLVNMFIYTGIALYAPSLALSAVTPINIHLCIIVLAIVCTITSSLGGAKAVVYTDTFQAIFMFGGVIAVIIQGCIEMGGIDKVWEVDQAYGRIEFWNFDPDPLVRNSFWSCTTLGVYFALNAFGANQAQFQRWGAVKNIKQSYFIIYSNVFGVVLIWSLIYLSGLVVFAVYADCDPLTEGLIDKTDQIMVYFVVDKLGYLPGIPGLFVAAVFSGVLSTVSSQINSIAALMWEDLLKGMTCFASVSENRSSLITKLISVCAGTLAAMLGLLSESLGGIIQACYSVSGALAGPITGLLLNAICCPWVKVQSGFFGFVCGLLINLWVVVGTFLYAPPAPLLPLSTEGCPTDNQTTTYSTTEDYTITTMHITSANPNDDVFDLYKLSYCYIGAMGVIITMTMGNLAACIIGFTKPENVPSEYVNQSSLRFYRWLRPLHQKHKEENENTEQIDENDKIHESNKTRTAIINNDDTVNINVSNKSCDSENKPNHDNSKDLEHNSRHSGNINLGYSEEL
ncbi:unnamed protein product [Meganyctiphanes norvegica]|uniref:Sodium-coupled monocarboxylate transporter 1 n=1 Tax=Meganyctiphanes norvegica TaxID=48144 RepID=A0AAV2Q1P7_MEGNR